MSWPKWSLIKAGAFVATCLLNVCFKWQKVQLTLMGKPNAFDRLKHSASWGASHWAPVESLSKLPGDLGGQYRVASLAGQFFSTTGKLNKALQKRLFFLRLRETNEASGRAASFASFKLIKPSQSRYVSMENADDADQFGILVSNSEASFVLAFIEFCWKGKPEEGANRLALFSIQFHSITLWQTTFRSLTCSPLKHTQTLISSNCLLNIKQHLWL